MEKKKYCIFACGGRGTRMGSPLPKQFLRLGEKTILQISIEQILKAVPDVHPVVVLPEDYFEFWASECKKTNFHAAQSIVAGGFTRFHSVRNALEKITDEDAVVAVHDGVRPLASTALIRRLFELAGSHNAVVPVIPITDTLKTLKRNGAGELEELPGEGADRSIMFGAQTPQLFRSRVLKSAYSLPYDTAFTDDASVVRASGVEIHYCEGEKYNLKITTSDDLEVARRLLSK